MLPVGHPDGRSRRQGSDGTPTTEFELRSLSGFQPGVVWPPSGPLMPLVAADFTNHGAGEKK